MKNNFLYSKGFTLAESVISLGILLMLTHLISVEICFMGKLRQSSADLPEVKIALLDNSINKMLKNHYVCEGPSYGGHIVFKSNEEFADKTSYILDSQRGTATKYGLFKWTTVVGGFMPIVVDIHNGLIWLEHDTIKVRFKFQGKYYEDYIAVRTKEH